MYQKKTINQKEWHITTKRLKLYKVASRLMASRMLRGIFSRCAAPGTGGGHPGGRLHAVRLPRRECHRQQPLRDGAM